jgi:hypothetical protein
MAVMDLIDKGIKARPGHRYSVTVPTRRVWILSLALPISPTAITFHGTAIVHQAGFPESHALLKGLVSLVPAGSRDTGWVIEIVPEGEFLTCAVGVSLRKVSNLAAALARVPTAQEGGPP